METTKIINITIQHCDVYVSKDGVKAERVEVAHVDQLATGDNNALVRLTGRQALSSPALRDALAKAGKDCHDLLAPSTVERKVTVTKCKKRESVHPGNETVETTRTVTALEIVKSHEPKLPTATIVAAGLYLSGACPPIAPVSVPLLLGMGIVYDLWSRKKRK